jgi:hypothetical protein
MSDRLTERFAQFADDVHVRPPVPAELIRARGERRGRRDAVVAAIATLVAVGSVSLLIGLSVAGGGSPLVQPGGPPETMLTATATAISTALRMPHEGEPGWARNDDPAAPGAFHPCDGADVTLPGRIAAVTTTGPGAAYEQSHLPTQLTEQLLLFDGVDAAQAALHGLNTQVQQCHWLGGIQDDFSYGVPMVAATNPRPGGEEFAMATLWGNTLILKYAVVTGTASFYPDLAGMHQISDQVCTTMGLCESVKCFDSFPSGSQPVYHSCPPSATPRPPDTGPSSRYPEPSPNPASAYPGGISPTPGPSGYSRSPGPSGYSPTPGPSRSIVG